MPHTSYFTTTELFFYYLQIESISAVIIIKINDCNNQQFNYTYNSNTVTVDAVFPCHSQEFIFK